jgi:hypothetical protein
MQDVLSVAKMAQQHNPEDKRWKNDAIVSFVSCLYAA